VEDFVIGITFSIHNGMFIENRTLGHTCLYNGSNWFVIADINPRPVHVVSHTCHETNNNNW